GRISAHAPACLVDAPAAASGIARPHERDGAPFARRRAKTPDLRGTERARKRMILETDAIEHVLPGGQVLEQRLGGEMGLRQSVDEDRAANSLEDLAGRHLDQHARRSIRPRPDNRGIDGDIAGLDAWVITGRSAARLNAGLAMPSAAAI